MPAAEASQCVEATIPNVPASWGRVVKGGTAGYASGGMPVTLPGKAQPQ